MEPLGKVLGLREFWFIRVFEEFRVELVPPGLQDSRGLGFRVLGFGFRDWGLGFRVGCFGV